MFYNVLMQIKFDDILLEKDNTLHINVINLLEFRKSQIVSDTNLIDLIRLKVKDKNILDIDVGKRLTISMLEKGLFFINELATMLYSLEELNIISCKLRNVPCTFETMLGFLKPILSKHALSVLEIEKK